MNVRNTQQHSSLNFEISGEDITPDNEFLLPTLNVLLLTMKSITRKGPEKSPS